MTKVIPSVNPATGHVNDYFVLANTLAQVLANEIVTTNSAAGGGALSAGNGFNVGIFGSTTLVATSIQGGNVVTANTLWVGSNVNMNTFSFFSGNVTINNSIIQVGANLSLNTTSISLGNSSVNVSVNTSTVNTVNLIANSIVTNAFAPNTISVGSNITVGANISLNTTSFFVGNSTVNTFINNSSILISNSTIKTTITDASISIGNSTINNSTNSTLISLANSTAIANLSQSGLIVGSVVINQSNVEIGSNIAFTNTQATFGTASFSANGSLGSNGMALYSNGTSAFWNAPQSAIEFVIDGGGLPLANGIGGYLEVPFSCNINRVTLLADQSGNCIIDIWSCTYSNFNPGVHPIATDSITSADIPTISATNKYQDSTLTGWTTAIPAGNILAFEVKGAATLITRVTTSLLVTRTS